MKTHVIQKTLLLCLFVASPCLGWGREGHKIASSIATHYLAPEAQAAVTQLLGDQSIADVSTWADEIRSDPSYRWASPLHYANVKPEADGFDLKRDCPAQGCVVSAIIKYADVLRSEDASSAERTEALKFLIHFVQDVHQPLHVSRARDKGGNDIKVEFFHDRTNLHRVWDSGLIRRTKKPWPACAAELQQAITPEQLAKWKSTDPVEWATESYELALSHAYAIPEDGQIGQDYMERCIPVVNKRLAMSGVRLATLLNAIFADKTITTDTGSNALISRVRDDLPMGWKCTVLKQRGQMGHPHGLDEPLFRVDFTDPSQTFDAPGDKGEPKKRHPLIQLYFYDIAAKPQVMTIIEDEAIFSWNIPIYFGETENYVVVTSPFYVNHGVFTAEARSTLFPAWKILRSHIANKEDKRVEELAEPDRGSIESCGN